MKRKTRRLLVFGAVVVLPCAFVYYVASNLLTNPSRMNSLTLFLAAHTAGNTDQVENKAFYLLAAQARYQIDKQVYPPVGTGTGGPGMVIAALASSIGQQDHAALERDPAAFSRAVVRLSKWTPEFGFIYHPGWKYRKRLSNAEAAAVVTATLKPVLQAAQSRVKLLSNAEYLRLSQIVKEAGAVEGRYYGAINERRQVSADLERDYHEAWERKNVALLGMRNIEIDLCPETRWHAVVKWKAEDYFDDPQVIALCRAIEANDIAEMERLIASGTNVKAIGKGGMTPLLWAFPERQLDRFRCLLEHGADPDVTIESDFGVHGRPLHPHPRSPLFGVGMDDGCRPGQSVTTMAARSPDPEFLRVVLEHGGDPNSTESETGMTPLNIAIESNSWTRRERIAMLLAKGADLDRYSGFQRATPVMLALRKKDYSTMLQLLNAGADPSRVRYLLDEPAPKLKLPERAADYQALLEWLEEHKETGK